MNDNPFLMKFPISFLILFLPFQGYSQQLFAETFEKCNTDRFVMESDSITIQPVEDLIEVLSINMEEQTIEKIRGILFIQVLVDQKGRSCLLSAENSTNIATEDLFLKDLIDHNLFWQWPDEQTAVVIGMNFHENAVQFLRIGINDQKGFHPIQYE